MTELIADGSLLLALPIAFLAGLVSFLSPCVLPLAPGYLAYVAGMTGTDLMATGEQGATPSPRAPATVGADAARGTATDRRPPGDSVPRTPTGTLATPVLDPNRWRVVWGAVLFVLGFTAVFVSYGLAFGELGSWLVVHQRTIAVVLGVVVVLLGLGFMGMQLLTRTMWWNRERRPGFRPPTGLWGAPLLGVVFGLGWTPCIGPTLAAVQTLAFTEASATRGALLSVAYCVGLGLPFVAIAWGLRWSAGALAWTRTHSRGIAIAGGAMLVIVGVLLVTGWWNDIVAHLQGLLPTVTVVL